MRARVVIVGAGPGGSAAAIALARQGIDVLLLDKDTFPRDKTCGSGLSPHGVALADELGIGAEVRARAYPIHALRLTTPRGREMLLSSDVSAVVLLRKDFDNLLVERAVSLGARFHGGFSARALLTEGGRVVGVQGRNGETVRGDYVLCADGAHSIFSRDPRPKRSISTLMGWWEGVPFRPHTLEMVYDRALLPLYGWLFPETPERVNIGICMEGQDEHGGKTRRNVREVFARFLDDHYRDRLAGARPVGRWKGHPIVYTTWIAHCTTPGALYLGEAARVTHNATGEGISQAMQSGLYAAEALTAILTGRRTEGEAFATYTRALRWRFTGSFLAGHLLRAVLRTPLLDGIATVYNAPEVRRAVTGVLGSALAGRRVAHRDDTGSNVPRRPAVDENTRASQSSQREGLLS
jgi:geranylgeranyl reductase family protein